MNLFIGNLSRDVTEAELRTAFQTYGEIVSLNIVKDKFNGVSKGFAFVEMATEAAGEAAIAGLHRTPMKGQSLDVTIARPKQERKGGHGGKHGGGGRRRTW